MTSWHFQNTSYSFGSLSFPHLLLTWTRVGRRGIDLQFPALPARSPWPFSTASNIVTSN
jgi:hypothetical protein